MRKFLALLFFFLGAPLCLLAQSTNLTLNVTDAGGVAWGNGTYALAFVGDRGSTWRGGAIIPFSGTLSATGSATIASVPDNNTIVPSPSFWQVTVCPNSAITTTLCFIGKFTVTGTTLTLNITPPAISIPVPTTTTLIPPVTAYADAEISGGWVGFQYFQYNAATPSSSVGRVCQVVSGGSCTTWAAAGGGGLHVIGYSFGDAATGATLTTSEVGYVTVPFACSITGWHIMADAGTVTVKVARVNAGTALPTIGSNSISTSGVSLSSGTKIDSTTVTDFTSTLLAKNDTLGFFITAVATAKQVTFQLDCQ